MKGVKVEDGDKKKILFPLAASIKYDGIRCLVDEQKSLSASLKLIPNKFVRDYLASDQRFHGFDGELMLRNSTEFNEVQSAFMSRDGEPDFEYYVFDYWNRPDQNFYTRYDCMKADGIFEEDNRIIRVEHTFCYNLDELDEFEYRVLSQGFEGIMTRHLDRPYKYGKASLSAKQQNCLKRKPMVEMEAIIVGFVEQEENQNPLEKNELGLAKRSSHKENMVGKGTLGKFIVRNAKFGEFLVGTGRGLTAALRQSIWDNQSEYLGKIINFSYQLMGTLDKPRLPIYRGFRDPVDMDPSVYEELLKMAA